MDDQPLVSIIVNNYNYGRFLREAIDSALAQAYPRVEVIVVDDGSTDDSRDIIRSYGSSITPILKENGGQASAFNAGFARSRGDIVIFLDSDDVLLAHTAEQVADAFRDAPDTAKVQYRMRVIDAGGEVTNTFMPSAGVAMPSGDLRRHALNFPADITWMATSGNAFAASVLREILPAPEQHYPVTADQYVCHMTHLFGPVVSLPEVGAYYRIHGTNNFGGLGMNLETVRRSIQLLFATHRYLEQCARRQGMQGLAGANGDVPSVSFLARRLISLKLEPARHPVKGDNVPRLLIRGVRVSFRRFDVPWSTRLLFAIWFFAMALAPPALGRRLAEAFLVPETRPAILPILSRVRRASR